MAEPIGKGSPNVERLRGFSPEEVMAEAMETALTPTSLGKAVKELGELIAK